MNIFVVLVLTMCIVGLMEDAKASPLTEIKIYVDNEHDEDTVKHDHLGCNGVGCDPSGKECSKCEAGWTLTSVGCNGQMKTCTCQCASPRSSYQWHCTSSPGTGATGAVTTHNTMPPTTGWVTEAVTSDMPVYTTDYPWFMTTY